MLLVPEDRSGIDHTDWVSAEQEAGHDAKVSAASSEPPEKIRLLGLIRRNETPVRQHHIGLH
jgi:hypothetical protein